MSLIKVVVLDGHVVLRQGLSRLLPSYGLEVVGEYGDVESFLRGIPKDAPKVAVIDCFQPMGDSGLIETLRERHPQLAVVVLSGYSEPGLAERCLENGAAAFLDKGVTGLDALAAAITQVSQGNRFCPVEALQIGVPVALPEEPEPMRKLSHREREVLAHLAVGEDNLKIAACLGISERTVKAHVCSLYRKLGQENRTQMALFARQLGIKPRGGFAGKREAQA